MSDVKNIYQRINSVIEEGLYIKRGSAGQGTGVLYDETISMLSPLLRKHGIVFTVEKCGESRSRANAKGNYIYESDFNVTYINIDSPDDKFTTVIEAHAMDAGDKATGKAITYATKISLLKVFQIETGLNDESREEIKEKLEEMKTYTEKQFQDQKAYMIERFKEGANAETIINSIKQKKMIPNHVSSMIVRFYEECKNGTV